MCTVPLTLACEVCIIISAHYQLYHIVCLILHQYTMHVWYKYTIDCILRIGCCTDYMLLAL